jgi:hypothetical protein
VIPGLELSDNCDDPDRSAHALALGLEQHVSVDTGIVAALEAANAAGAAIVAAHPYGAGDLTADAADTPDRERARDVRPARPPLRALQPATRSSAGWPPSGLPAIATGDVHRAEHLASWKTLPPLREGRRGGRRLPPLERTRRA